jgi:hypothetical protein
MMLRLVRFDHDTITFRRHLFHPSIACFMSVILLQATRHTRSSEQISR